MLFVSPHSSSISAPLPLSSSFLLALPPPRTLSVSLLPCARRAKKRMLSEVSGQGRGSPSESCSSDLYWKNVRTTTGDQTERARLSLSSLPPPPPHTQVVKCMSVMLFNYFFFCCMLVLNIVNTFSIKIFQIFSARSTLLAWHEPFCLEACPLVWYEFCTLSGQI